MIKAKLGKRSQLVLPKAIVDSLKLEEGVEFEVKVVDGRIVMEPMLSIPRSQAWFWTERWQRAEKEAEDDVRGGRISTIASEEDLKSYLDRLHVDHD